MKKDQDFAFKDLLVWHKANDFADSVLDLTENPNTPTRHYRLIEQMEASATSVPQNIARPVK